MNDLSMILLALLFLLGATAIAVFGTRLSGIADQLADRTGLGEAFVGAVFLGACTSLPGITASVTAAIDGFPSLAIANAVGGIAVQTTFLVVADLAYPKTNLEHAAASVPNMLQGALLMTLLSTLMLGVLAPQYHFLGIHPVSVLMFFGYGFGLKLVHRSHARPMWKPHITVATRQDIPDERPGSPRTLTRLWSEFIAAGALLLLAGLLVTRVGEEIGLRTGLTESLIGGLLVAVTTSLPELVTSLAAVRRGALTLAVSGVLGGNAFDTLFAAVADVAYRPGPIYAAISWRESTMITLTTIMSGVLLLGLLSRERRGPANIGFEGILVLAIYLCGIVVLGSGNG